MIELSCDLGEATDAEGIAVEEAIWPLIDAANVACGGHAGDEASMRKAAANAARRGIVLGAHPSYPDRAGFGRVSLEIADDDLVEALVLQIRALQAVAVAEGVPLRRVKAHGALYNDAHGDPRLARVIVDAVVRVDPAITVVAADASETAAEARRRGLRVIREAFADRRYEPGGALVPRKEAGSLLSVEEAALQAAVLVEEGRVVARNGTKIPIPFETICIHADMAHAVERLRAIRTSLGR